MIKKLSLIFLHEIFWVLRNLINTSRGTNRFAVGGGLVYYATQKNLNKYLSDETNFVRKLLLFAAATRSYVYLYPFKHVLASICSSNGSQC